MSPEEESLKEFDLSREDVIKFLRYIAFIGENFDPRYLFRPSLKDEDDDMFVELAVAGNSKFLKHRALLFRDFELTTPAEFAKEWRRSNG